jgi:hypothetical protein
MLEVQVSSSQGALFDILSHYLRLLSSSTVMKLFQTLLRWYLRCLNFSLFPSPCALDIFIAHQYFHPIPQLDGG